MGIHPTQTGPAHQKCIVADAVAIMSALTPVTTNTPSTSIPSQTRPTGREKGRDVREGVLVVR